jgi:hypothetical protein
MSAAGAGLNRRSLFGVAVLPLMANAQPEPVSVASLCHDYRRALAAISPIERALQDALAECSRLQDALHQAEDAPSYILDALEVMPATTFQEASAKVSIAQALVREDIDPKRHEFLAAALAELEEFRA